MMSNPNMPSNISQPNVGTNAASVSNAPPNVTAGPNVSVPNVSVPNLPNTTGAPPQMQTAPINQMSQMININQMAHMARNQPANPYQGSKISRKNQSQLLFSEQLHYFHFCE